MRVLIDTQAMIWYAHSNPSLKANCRAIIDDPSTVCFVSLASIWEMAIKLAIGKLDLRSTTTGSAALQQFVALLPGNDIALLPITADDTIAVADLPTFKDHGDPFDRLIAVQCLRHDLTLISIDDKFDRYGVRRVWS